jgi:hypothetical protein
MKIKITIEVDSDNDNESKLLSELLPLIEKYSIKSEIKTKLNSSKISDTPVPKKLVPTNGGASGYSDYTNI